MITVMREIALKIQGLGMILYSPGDVGQLRRSGILVEHMHQKPTSEPQRGGIVSAESYSAPTELTPEMSGPGPTKMSLLRSWTWSSGDHRAGETTANPSRRRTGACRRVELAGVRRGMIREQHTTFD